MSDEPKTSDKGNADGSLVDLSTNGLIVVLQALLADLEEQARPIQDRIRAIRQLLKAEQDKQFLDARRQQRAFARQPAASLASKPGEEGYTRTA